MIRTRPAVLSGTWYPDDPQTLGEMVDGFLAKATPTEQPRGRPLIGVVPHAGFQYSGTTAGRLYGLLPGEAPRRVLILAPNHRKPLNVIALSGYGAFATPLGEVPVDRTASAQLATLPSFAVDDEAHAMEHAIEIQLPFLQRTWPQGGFAILPMLVPGQPAAAGPEAAQALAKVIDDDTLVLISSDFTHYGADYGYVPFTSDIPSSLEKLDAGAILKILAGDGPGLQEYGARTGITMCGLAAAALVLAADVLPPDYEGALLDYTRSADQDADYSLSVSYAAILLASGGPADKRGRHV